MKKKYPAQIKQFGDKIRELRLSSELTQLELAELSGIDKRSIQRIEGGEFAASLNILLALAQAFKISPNELLLNIDLPLRSPVKTKKQ